MRHRLAIALLALLPLQVAAGEDPPAHKPFPKEGLDAPFVGIPGLPLEWKDGNGDLRRRKAKPRKLKDIEGGDWVVEFEYVYADPAVEKAARESRRAIWVTLTAFHRAGRAHLWLNHRFTFVSHEEMDYGEDRGSRPWHEGRERAELPGLFFRGKGPNAVDLVGISRHVAIDVDWANRPLAADGGNQPEVVAEMRKRVTAICTSLIGVVEAAPSATSTPSEGTFRVAHVRIEFHGEKRLGYSEYRVRAQAQAGADRQWLPAILWVDDQVLRNDESGQPSGAMSATVKVVTHEHIVIFAVDDGPVFRLLHIHKFRDHPMGYTWP